MNKQEFEARFRDDSTTVLAWIKDHQKVSIIVGCIVLGVVLGFVLFH